MRIFIDNFFQNCCGLDIGRLGVWLLCSVVSSAIIVLFTICQTLFQRAGQKIGLFMAQIQKGLSLHKWLSKSIYCLPKQLKIPATIGSWPQEGANLYLYVLALWLSFMSCLLLPWSASHCNLPSKITLCGLDSSISFILFFGLLLASNGVQTINSLIYGDNSEISTRLVERTAWLSLFMMACLGPVVLTGQISISAAAEMEEEGLFGLPWLSIYAIPCFCGLAAALISLHRWEDISRQIANFQSSVHNCRLGYFMETVTEKFNFLALSSLIILFFGGSWNLPTLTYPAYINLGFLVAPYTDLICGLIVFALKLSLFSILWPSIHTCLQKQRRIRPSVLLCLLLILLNLAICAALAGMYQIYLGG
ncbi:MAG: hypothetical protein ACI38Q_04025 [Candidatus Bruticola sp.]